MSRIHKAFDHARAESRGALIGYITAGDPDLAMTAELAVGGAEAGLDILELGIPFSDPMADGPVIQAASQRALAAGTTVTGVLRCVEVIRQRTDLPLLVMTYYNPVLRYGPDRFVADAVHAGVDAALVTDLPPDEAAEWCGLCRSAGLGTVFLVAPTTTPERAARAAACSTAFVYCVTRTGVTGESASLPDDVTQTVALARAGATCPVALGFGISTPQQVRAAWRVADGAIVGSALVRVIGTAAERGESPLEPFTRAVRALRSG